jgi:hypothetical protein
MKYKGYYIHYFEDKCTEQGLQIMYYAEIYKTDFMGEALTDEVYDYLNIYDSDLGQAGNDPEQAIRNKIDAYYMKH